MHRCWSRTPGLDFNEALGSAIGSARGAGVRRVVIVADRHHSGNNVMSLPTGPPMELRYGDGSCTAHQAAALAAGLGRMGRASDFAISTDPG